MKKLYLIVAFLFALSACRQEVQDTFPEFPQKPVVNALFSADSLLTVNVSLSGNVNAKDLQLVDDAVVTLFCDNDTVEVLNCIHGGSYISTEVLKAGHRYTCTVQSPKFHTVTVTDSIPLPAKILGLEFVPNSGVNEEFQSYPALKVTFSNSPQSKMYYHLVLRRVICPEYQIFGYVDGPLYLEKIVDPVLVNEGLSIPVFSNDLMTDTTYQMYVNFISPEGGSVGGGEFRYYKIGKFVVELRSISRDFYYFLRYLNLYESGRYKADFGHSLTVFNLYSNVPDGYGIFAGYSAVVCKDTIDAYPYGY